MNTDGHQVPSEAQGLIPSLGTSSEAPTSDRPSSPIAHPPVKIKRQRDDSPMGVQHTETRAATAAQVSVKVEEKSRDSSSPTIKSMASADRASAMASPRPNTPLASGALPGAQSPFATRRSSIKTEEMVPSVARPVGDQNPTIQPRPNRQAPAAVPVSRPAVRHAAVPVQHPRPSPLPGAPQHQNTTMAAPQERRPAAVPVEGATGPWQHYAATPVKEEPNLNQDSDIVCRDNRGSSDARSASGPKKNREDESDDAALIMTDVLDSRGDLFLRVALKDDDGDIRQFQVCSRTLFRASPKLELQFNRRDSPPPMQARPLINARPKPKTMTISGVNPQALAVVLQLIHGQVTKVFDKLKNRELLGEVLVVTQKLEMDACLAPVAAKFMTKIVDLKTFRHDVLGPQLWITYRFGLVTLMRKTIAMIVSSSRITADGQLVGFGGETPVKYSDYHPLRTIGILSDLVKCRAAVIDGLIEWVNRAIHKLTHTATAHRLDLSSRTNVCKGANWQSRCDSLMLGAFQRALAEHKWSYTVVEDMAGGNDGLRVLKVRMNPSLDEFRGSARQMHRNIQAMVKEACTIASPWGQSHQVCNPMGDEQYKTLDDFVRDALNTVRLGEDDFATRARAVGLETTDEFNAP
ncbi:hypothetical protein QBC47DRAFT_404968 [Echria macrotheca]|uniref:Uncharacterized protein n=1 Tax=Echria macrotheca TaxID=438768 RepID=A0AAJ0B6L4_9PEZI|nr:hypothetical protein QBC47DRAFT_404968 [Echria macrotheca]